ncbi:sulfite exporter TauE/SafE family protein [Lentibacillus sp. N15]|uniref:HoxN/HupN/NixA family nickel/cobalt transporter n=1 Tax=Lentibacillus songyuanensis TaxID=3136161 RepID=UPI0031BB3515
MGIIYVILVAMGLGALHSLEPGHGKGVITAYLISSRATIKDAVFLGVSTAIAHTLSIIILAFVATSAVQSFLPGGIVYWIQLISGIVITYLGVKILYRRIRPQIVVMEKVGYGYGYAEPCEHHHGLHHNIHIHESPSSPSRLLALGFFIGLIPCPSALAVLLAAIGAQHISVGLSFVAAFSVGGAITMSMIGLLVVRLGDSIKWMENWRVMGTLALLSSVLILGLGIFVVLQGLKGLVF